MLWKDKTVFSCLSPHHYFMRRLYFEETLFRGAKCFRVTEAVLKCVFLPQRQTKMKVTCHADFKCVYSQVFCKNLQSRTKLWPQTLNHLFTVVNEKWLKGFANSPPVIQSKRLFVSKSCSFFLRSQKFDCGGPTIDLFFRQFCCENIVKSWNCFPLFFSFCTSPASTRKEAQLAKVQWSPLHWNR